MTLVLKLDPDMVKMYLFKSYRPDRQTDLSEIITYPHMRMVMIEAPRAWSH